MRKTQISCIIPIHNEEELLKKTVHEVILRLEKSYIFELLLVENGSNDGSRDITKRIAKSDSRIKALFLPAADYGYALRYGFLNSRYPFIVNFSVDWIDAAFLQKALQKLETFDIVIASKNQKESHDKRSLGRRFGGIVFHRLVRFLFTIPVSDTHGIKVMKRKQVIDIIRKCQLTKELFDTELIIRAYKKGLHIEEIPVDVNEKRASRVSLTKRALRGVVQLIQLRYILWKENPH